MNSRLLQKLKKESHKTSLFRVQSEKTLLHSLVSEHDMDIKTLLHNLREEVSCSVCSRHIHRSETAAMLTQFLSALLEAMASDEP